MGPVSQGEIEGLTEAFGFRFGHEAMATRFEAVIAGAERDYARQAASAAFDEIDRLEAKLSRFVENSDVSQINREAGREAVRISVETFDCLRLAKRMAKETGGAFDATVGALMACWRSDNGSPRLPTPSEVAEARARTGWGLLELDEVAMTARLKAAGARIDLGAIGKGFALDRAAEILREWGVASALIHGGASTVLVLGAPPGYEGWPVGVGIGAFNLSGENEGEAPSRRRIEFRDKALSASGMAVKSRHIIDPRTGYPVGFAAGQTAAETLRAWAMGPSGGVADALSTAFMVMTAGEIQSYCRDHADASAMLLIGSASKRRLTAFGNWKAA